MTPSQLPTAWVRLAVRRLYRPVLRIHAALVYIDAAGLLVGSIVLWWNQRKVVRTFGLVSVDAVGAELGCLGLLLAVTGTGACQAHYWRNVRPPRFLVVATWVAWVSLLAAALFSPAVMDA